MGENQAKGTLERDKITKMKMDRPYRSMIMKIYQRKPSSGTCKEEEEKEDPGLHGEAQ
jgi:hypothetical protein